MNKNKRNFLISGILIGLSVIFTILVKIIDVKKIGSNGSSVGFATLNKFFFNSIGSNSLWYDVTELLGIIPLLIALCYGVIGFVQLIKRKSVLKVDKELMILAIFYVTVVSLYVFFEIFVINYRPILIDGVLEASYPSSHTLLALCICGSSVIINNKLFNKKYTKFINIALIIVGLIIVIGRLLSGVHWFTDIIGGILISASLLMTLYSLVYKIKR